MQPSNVLPKSPGIAAIGDSTLYARADHVHPHDDAKLDKSGGTMTGSLILKSDPTEDLEATTKQYVDNHTSDVVLYTSQTLTNDQKTQARGNIGAVDSASLNRIGAVIGLCGWNQIIPTKAYVNSVTDTKTYLDFTIQAYLGNAYVGVLFNQYQSTPGKIVGIFTSKYDCNRITWKHNGAKTDVSLVANTFWAPAQIKTGDKLLVSLDVLSVNPTVAGGLSTDNQMLINLTELFGAGNEPSSVDEFRAIFGATYYPYYDYPTAITKNGIVEYLNPPMELGVEYRTTERYMGKPVYVQMMDWGRAPAKGTAKYVAVPEHSINQQLVWAQLTYFGITFPRYGANDALSMYIYVAQGSARFEIYSPGEDRSDNGTIQAIVKYTKDTD